jgi:hypothetical protein
LALEVNLPCNRVQVVKFLVIGDTGIATACPTEQAGEDKAGSHQIRREKRKTTWQAAKESTLIVKVSLVHHALLYHVEVKIRTPQQDINLQLLEFHRVGGDRQDCALLA